MAVPQFSEKPPIGEEIAFLPEDLSLIDEEASIEDQNPSIEDEEEMDMPEHNYEGFYRVDDMFLDEAQYKLNFGTEEERQGIPDKSYRWPNGIVPYKFESSVPRSQKKKIRAAIAVMNKALVNCIEIQ